MTSGNGSHLVSIGAWRHRSVPRMAARRPTSLFGTTPQLLTLLALLVVQLGCESKGGTDSPGTSDGGAASDSSASGDPAGWTAPDVTSGDGPTVDPPCSTCLPEGSDYFTEVWNVPFDYDEPYDFTWESGIENLHFDGGWLRGTIAEVTDPQLFILFAGIHGNVNWGQGQDRPIDSTHYTRLSYRLCLETSETNPSSLLYWYQDGPSGHSEFQRLEAGCHIYTHDLASYETWAETGEQHGLRFDLNNVAIGDEFALDWVRLTAVTGNTTPVPWAEASGEASELGLYIDDDASGWDGDLAVLVSEPEANGELVWGEDATGTETLIYPSDLPPGEYRLYWQDDAGGSRSYVDEPLIINRAPRAIFLNPTKTSGLRYDQETKTSWDLSAEGAGGTVTNCPGSVFESGEVRVTCSANDPQFKFSVEEPIDGSYYRYLTLDIWSQYSFRSPSPGGGMMRVLWGQDGGTSEDILISHAERWTTHTFDLQEMNAEGRVPTGWEEGSWTWLRFDPNENTNGADWEWRLRAPLLTGPPVASGSIELSWTTANESEPVLVILSHASSPAGIDSEEITRFVSSTAEESFAWDTRDVSPGDHTLQACLFDGLQTRCTVADVPVRVLSGTK